MDEVLSGVPARLVVKIPKEKLKAFEGLWAKKQETTKSYQRSKSEDAARGMKAIGEDEDEDETRARITHFKKRIIRTHSASAAAMPPTEQTQECLRLGRHHLPATTPMAPPHRHRLSQETPVPLPKSPEIISDNIQKEKLDNTQKLVGAHNSENTHKLLDTQKLDKPQLHESMEQEFAKVLNNFYAIIDTVRSAFHHNKEIIKGGIAEVESFLHMCENFANKHFVFEEHRVFYSFLDCMRDFIRRIRMTMYDESRTAPLLTPVEESFYKNVFFRMSDYITSNSAKNEMLSTINCIIWKQREVETGNMIVLPLIGHSPCSSQCCHPPKKEETSKTESESKSLPKSISNSPSIFDHPRETSTSSTDSQMNTKSESKEEVQKEIQEMQKKKPKYKISEILCIEIDSDCDSSDDVEERPIKTEPKEVSDNEPPKTLSVNPEETNRIAPNTKIVENDQPRINDQVDRNEIRLDTRSKEDLVVPSKRETNLQQPKRIRTESSSVIQQPPIQKVRVTPSEATFRQQFPNTVISRRDGDIISDGRVVVLEKGKVAEENKTRMPPPYPPYPAIPGPIKTHLPPPPPPPPYPTTAVSQTVKQFANLSTKEALDPIEYVKEIDTLCKIPNIPDEFKHFYAYITKVQILHKHNPIAFRLFLELLNQGGLKDYHMKFREYAARKIVPPSSSGNVKKRVHSKR